jgi:hypothetical protein
VDGDDAVFHGDGDIHDSKYDHLRRWTLFGEQLMEPISSPTYTGPPLSASPCASKLRVYPSKELEDSYVNSFPMIATIVTACIFAFTSLVFVTYDWLVERRQRTVMTSATRADNLVSSLFPTHVKESLYRNQDEEANKAKWNTGPKEFLGIENPNASDVEEVNPIADLYPETTIMFAGKFREMEGLRLCIFAYNLLFPFRSRRVHFME